MLVRFRDWKECVRPAVTHQNVIEVDSVLEKLLSQLRARLFTCCRVCDFSLRTVHFSAGFLSLC